MGFPFSSICTGFFNDVQLSTFIILKFFAINLLISRLGIFLLWQWIIARSGVWYSSILNCTLLFWCVLSNSCNCYEFVLFSNMLGRPFSCSFTNTVLHRLFIRMPYESDMIHITSPNHHMIRLHYSSTTCKSYYPVPDFNLAIKVNLCSQN